MLSSFEQRDGLVNASPFRPPSHTYSRSSTSLEKHNAPSARRIYSGRTSGKTHNKLSTSNRSNGTLSLAQQPSPTLSAMSYRRLGIPRSDLSDFVKIDLETKLSELKLDNLPERMQLLDMFIADFASQIKTDKLSKAQTPRMTLAQSPENTFRRSYTDAEDFESKAILNGNVIHSDNDFRPDSSSVAQTPTIPLHMKRRQAASRALANRRINYNHNNARTGSFVRSRTFDTSMLPARELLSPHPVSNVTSAIVTLTKKEKTIPLTYSGDVRSPTPNVATREVPEMWTKVGDSNAAANQTYATFFQKQQNQSNNPSSNIAIMYGNKREQSHQQMQQQRTECLNVAKLRQMLDDNKIKVLSSQAGAKIAQQLTMHRARIVLPPNQLGRDIISPVNPFKRQPLSPRIATGVDLTNPSRPETDNRVKTSPVHESLLPRPPKNSRQNTLDITERSPSSLRQSNDREKSTKTVRFRLVEDVRFYSPWSSSPLTEDASHVTTTEPLNTANTKVSHYDSATLV